MRLLFVFIFIPIFTLSSWSQNYAGIFEVGDDIPLLQISADALTGAPTNPINLKYDVYKSGSFISTGGLNNVALGVASATYNTTGNTPGTYHVLFSGLINNVTAYGMQTYTLVPEGYGSESVGSEVAGLNGLTPLNTSSFQQYHTETLAAVHSTAESVTTSINIVQSDLTALISETKTGTRELSRSRLWYAQSTINFATRKVPADLPSHLEVQLAASNDIVFASPVETFFKVYYYPDAASSTKASREVRSSTPPQDGAFYLQPNISWDE